MSFSLEYLISLFRMKMQFQFHWLYILPSAIIIIVCLRDGSVSFFLFHYFHKKSSLFYYSFFCLASVHPIFLLWSLLFLFLLKFLLILNKRTKIKSRVFSTVVCHNHSMLFLIHFPLSLLLSFALSFQLTRFLFNSTNFNVFAFYLHPNYDSSCSFPLFFLCDAKSKWNHKAFTNR
jgi:hypothetical protein